MFSFFPLSQTIFYKLELWVIWCVCRSGSRRGRTRQNKFRKNVRFSLKNLQNMPKMFRLSTFGDQFKMCAHSKHKSWIRAWYDLWETRTAYPPLAHAFTSMVFFVDRVAHLFRFLCCVFCFVWFCSLCLVSKVAYFSGLSILDCPFSFLCHIFLDYLYSWLPLQFSLTYFSGLSILLIAPSVFFDIFFWIIYILDCPFSFLWHIFLDYLYSWLPLQFSLPFIYTLRSAFCYVVRQRVIKPTDTT
jgi:hypothetical protein